MGCCCGERPLDLRVLLRVATIVGAELPLTGWQTKTFGSFLELNFEVPKFSSTLRLLANREMG